MQLTCSLYSQIILNQRNDCNLVFSTASKLIAVPGSLTFYALKMSEICRKCQENWGGGGNMFSMFLLYAQYGVTKRKIFPLCGLFLYAKLNRKRRV